MNSSTVSPFHRFVIAALLLVAPLFSAAQTSMIDSIVAIVEEDVILRSELDRALAAVLQQFQQSRQPLPSRNVLERQVLERLTLVKLQLQRADATGIRINDEEIDRAIQNVARQAGITVDQMRRTILADGLSWQEFRDDMRDELKTQQLRRRVANSRVNVTETEVDIFLASNDIDRGEFRLSHILIGVPEGASPEQVQAARDKADSVHQELEAGADFTTAAITYSDGQYALQGGDLGWRPADQVPTLFAEQIIDMETGEITRPMRSASGFHILRVADFRETSQKMVEEISAKHIMIEVTELVTAEQAVEIITDLHNRIETGEDFGELAKQYSDDATSANIDGDLGWFQPGQYGQRLQQVLDGLGDGDVSQPFQTVNGWHLLMRTGTRTQDRTEEILRSQARESIRRQKAEEELQLWERQMRDEAYVEFRI